MKTNIIILTYNKLEYTQECITSIRDFTRPGTYQIIVVDNCSTDGTREWLAEQTDILTIFNDENVGFPKGCNQGIELTTSGDILLLNNDIIVSPNWLDLLNECLYSSEDIGAVGPNHNGELAVSYKTVGEYLDFAQTHNQSDPSQWEHRLKLIGFCMLIKREAVEKVGYLDERFTPGNCEDTDYSFRIIKTGYKIVYCKNVYIHHYGSVSFGEIPERYIKLLEVNRKKFLEKWGFHSVWNSRTRHDLITIMDRSKGQIRVLDIGCGCGATLLEIKNRFPDAQLFGVEPNVNAAAVASKIADIQAINVEELNDQYPSDFFDYILIENVLEKVESPIEVLQKLKTLLKKDGQMIAGILNFENYGVLTSILNGTWIDSNNHNLFTLQKLAELFKTVGFNHIEYNRIESSLNNQEQRVKESLSGLVSSEREEILSASELIIKAFISKDSDLEQHLLGFSLNNKDGLKKIIELMNSGSIDENSIINSVHKLDTNKVKLLNNLAVTFFKNSMFDHVVPLLNAALEMDEHNTDTLYNYAYILHTIGADKEALFYLNFIENPDQDILHLKNEIAKNISE
ncbi:glycosyltransferase [Paenibacillus sp. FSL R5-0407]|uniref:glycosyltransferase n=1 Tax=Paenibacillus sp. FSL R5-0407 TaxID=2975320 RepID=UPI0030F91BDC